jgi:hypothetical protein
MAFCCELQPSPASGIGRRKLFDQAGAIPLLRSGEACSPQDFALPAAAISAPAWRYEAASAGLRLGDLGAGNQSATRQNHVSRTKIRQVLPFCNIGKPRFQVP